MNQQTITAFHTFNSALSNAVNTLHESLQQTNAFNSIYADQFNDIIKFQQKSKAFTCFLQEQNEYHKLQYTQFKSKMNSNSSTKPAIPVHTTVSSQISIQSTPQSLNDWSYTANDRVSTTSAPEYQRWRAYDPQPNTYNDYLFNNAEIERIPFKVIDTDNDSDCTSEAQFVPSLPPSINDISDIDSDVDDGKEELENKEDYNYDYDVCDGAEDDEKWDLYPLIKTHAFTGFFDTAPTAPLEFKNDKVLKPPPTKWQEREEQNREIINTLFQSLQTQQKEAPPPPLYSNEEANINAEIVYVDSEEIVNGPVNVNVNVVCEDNNNNNNDVQLDIDEADDNISSIIGMKRRRSMDGLVSKNVSFIKGQPPPIKFIEYEAPKASVYNNIEEHPHFHPLIHGEEDEEGKNGEETGVLINGEDMADMDNQISEALVANATSQHCINKINNSKQHEHVNEAQISKEIVTLKYALDKHFHVNHNDLTQMTKAIYSLRDHRCNANTNANIKIKKKKNQINGKAKKRKVNDHKHK